MTYPRDFDAQVTAALFERDGAVFALGDGTGAVMLDGKMEDDASLKQCLVILELAERLSANDPELAELYADTTETTEA